MVLTRHVVVFLILFWPFSALAEKWSSLEPGLDLLVHPFATKMGNAGDISVLRIDPACFTFDLASVSEHNTPLTPADWATRFNLIATINASMYLEDMSTSTGLMRKSSIINSSKSNPRFGAVLVFSPKKSGLPEVTILDRDADDWEKVLKNYNVVIQNFRMITPSGRILWTNEARAHPIASVGQDKRGNILFVFTEVPVTPPEFLNTVKSLGLDLNRLMYTEGGRPAGMSVRSRTFTHTWKGGANEVAVPNVIGIRRKTAN